MQLFKLNVTSFPEFTSLRSSNISPLKSILNMGEFELRASADSTIKSNKRNNGEIGHYQGNVWREYEGDS